MNICECQTNFLILLPMVGCIGVILYSIFHVNNFIIIVKLCICVNRGIGYIWQVNPEGFNMPGGGDSLDCTMIKRNVFTNYVPCLHVLVIGPGNNMSQEDIAGWVCDSIGAEWLALLEPHQVSVRGREGAQIVDQDGPQDLATQWADIGPQQGGLRRCGHGHYTFIQCNCMMMLSDNNDKDLASGLAG